METKKLIAFNIALTDTRKINAWTSKDKILQFFNLKPSFEKYTRIVLVLMNEDGKLYYCDFDRYRADGGPQVALNLNAAFDNAKEDGCDGNFIQLHVGDKELIAAIEKIEDADIRSKLLTIAF